MTPAARRLAAILTPAKAPHGRGMGRVQAKAVRERREAATDHVRRAGQLSPIARSAVPICNYRFETGQADWVLTLDLLLTDRDATTSSAIAGLR
jgi:hypothetical protein